MEEKIDYANPYLSKQIIAYIGNKRRLLPLIYEAIQRCSLKASEGSTFLDMFAGSGVVSRFAKYLDFKVLSNDWEYYTFIINKTYLEANDEDLKDMFQEYNGFDNLLNTLNNLPEPEYDEQYIARYYSPSSYEVENPDYRSERIFYTRQNGLMIDKIRNRIEELYPEECIDTSSRRQMEKHLLISLLLYESATHTNTSGVFKACHKGFGGHNKDALNRILAPIKLKRPVLIDSKYRAKVYKEDAAELILNDEIINSDIDIVYLDPPYNQHQYGSNYHMLNTIAKWDKLPVNNELNEDGVLKEKAAIRKDWINTKSDYCYRDKAVHVFSNLIHNIQSKYILISYSTEGIIPFETMKSICSHKGEIDIITNEYTKYRGGKQSINRLNKNIEFVLAIDTAGESTKYTIAKIDNVLAKKKLMLLFSKKYSLQKLQDNFIVDRKNKTIKMRNPSLTIATKDLYELIPGAGTDNLEYHEINVLINKLERSLCQHKGEELQEALSKLEDGECDLLYFLKKIPDILKKFAHKKYKNTFYYWLGKVKEINDHHPELYPQIKNRIDSLEKLALKRFTH